MNIILIPCAFHYLIDLKRVILLKFIFINMICLQLFLIILILFQIITIICPYYFLHINLIQ